MSNFRAAQPNFSKGELGEHLHGRFDVDAYQSAVKRGRNVIVLKYGGMDKRPGTQLVAEVLDASAPTRLLPFQFSLEQTYALEFGQGYMSPCALGGRLIEDELAITAISNAANARVTAALHGYSPGNRVIIKGVDGALGVYLNNRAFTVVAVPDANNFTITINTTSLPAFTGATGGITRTVAPDPEPVDPVVPDPVPDPDPPVVWRPGSNWNIP